VTWPDFATIAFVSVFGLPTMVTIIGALILGAVDDRRRARLGLPKEPCRTPERPAEILPPDGPRTVAEALRAAGVVPYTDREYPPCPKCMFGYSWPPSRYCKGAWWLSCRLREGHFHMRCRSCGAQWCMAPKDVDGAV
jgi:hypothetical protein